MLPILKQSQAKRMSQSESRLTLKKSTLSKTSKGVEQVQTYYQKCQQQLELNRKLKQLLTSIKSNVDASVALHEQEDEVAKLIKERRKEETDTQHQAHILNILISDNNKLKQEVDSERNKRAIYFNVYKNLQHEIHQWESKYKNLLIESMKTEGAITKIKERFRKATKKLQRDIQSINNEIDDMEKSELILVKQEPKPTTRTKNSREQTLIAVAPEEDKVITLSNVIVSSQKNNESPSGVHARKPQDFELEYEVEQKNIEVSGILSKLKTITGLSDMAQICKQFKNINQEVDYHYGLFKEEQKREKQLAQQIDKCQSQLLKVQAQNQERKSTKIVNIEGEKQIAAHQEIISELEAKLQERIGMKVGQLSNQMLLHHCLRVRDEKKEGKKNLQKFLQQTKKQKPEHNILLSPKEMHRKIIQGQTGMY